MKLYISTGNSRMEKKWNGQEMEFSVFLERLSHTVRTSETMEQYRKMSKAKQDSIKDVLWSSIFVTLMANKIGGLQFGIYRNCQISSRVFHTAVAALPLTKANRSDFE